MAMMFLQMVWDDTTRIGCGVANNDEAEEIYDVVRYSPTFYDKSVESMAAHVKPPKKYIFNKTSKLPNICFLPFISSSVCSWTDLNKKVFVHIIFFTYKEKSLKWKTPLFHRPGGTPTPLEK